MNIAKNRQRNDYFNGADNFSGLEIIPANYSVVKIPIFLNFLHKVPPTYQNPGRQILL
jgi:hypothetical protein